MIPEHYAGEIWKIHTADPLNYYTTELKGKRFQNTFEQQPISGKIDYDIDGKLVGNWFQEGTGDIRQQVREVGKGTGRGPSIAFMIIMIQPVLLFRWENTLVRRLSLP